MRIEKEITTHWNDFFGFFFVCVCVGGGVSQRHNLQVFLFNGGRTSQAYNVKYIMTCGHGRQSNVVFTCHIIRDPRNLMIYK